MPKVVDHERRRREIIEATWVVIARVGISGATIRTISEETGYSTGALAHYFSDKHDLLVQSLQVAHEEVRRLYYEASEGQDLRGIHALREYMLACLPLDEHRERLAAVEAAFWGEAVGNADLVEINKRETDGFYERIHVMLSDASDRGEIPPDTDLGAAARDLRLLIDGVSIQTVVYPAAPDASEQVNILDGLLARIQGQPKG